MLLPRKKEKQNRDVEFVSEEGMGFILSPLTDKAYDIIYEAMDRYIDLTMKQYIQDKVNQKMPDETVHDQIRGLLNFKQFLQKYKDKIKKV